MNIVKSLKLIFNHIFALLLITSTIHISTAHSQDNNSLSEILESIPPLMEAIERGDLETTRSSVEKLANTGWNINSSSFLDILSHWLVHMELIEPDGNEYEHFEYFYETPLVLATRNGHAYIVRYLVEETRADVNLRDGNGYAPLMHAAARRHGYIAEYLVERGANIHLRDRMYGRTAFIIAAWGGHIDIIRYFFEYSGQQIDLSLREDVHDSTSVIIYEDNRLAGSEKTALDFAALEGHIDVVEYLLERGANIDSQSTLGITPLMFAAYNNKIDVVKYLVERGANTSLRDFRNNTALGHALAQRYMNIANYLSIFPL